MRYGEKIQPKDQTAIDRILTGVLFEGEMPAYVTRINKVRGLLRWLVVTNWRVLAIGGIETRVAHAVVGEEIADVSIKALPGSAPTLRITTSDGQVLNLGNLVTKADAPDLSANLERVRAAAAPPPAERIAKIGIVRHDENVQYHEKVKTRDRTAVNNALMDALLEGERVEYATQIDRLRGMLSWLVVTNRRVLALSGIKLHVVHAFDVGLITAVKIEGSMDMIVIATSDGRSAEVGYLTEDSDSADLAGILERLCTRLESPILADPVSSLRKELSNEGRVWGSPSSKVYRTILAHCHTGERPWFVLGVGGAGALAAFEDRLMIIKLGLATSFMAGSIGGGRITTIFFRDITGIEYNSGIMTGVLEVSTPAYEASKNGDYWRGANRSRNADVNDPWTLSNTLQMDKSAYQRIAPRLDELRERISRSKNPSATLASSVASRSATQELAQLAELHVQGSLSDEEYSTAKAAVFARMREL